MEIKEKEVVIDKGTIKAEHIVVATHYPIMNMPGYYFLECIKIYFFLEA